MRFVEDWKFHFLSNFIIGPEIEKTFKEFGKNWADQTEEACRIETDRVGATEVAGGQREAQKNNRKESVRK